MSTAPGRTFFFGLLVGLVTLTLGVGSASAGCEKDTDCKGDRICEAGVCTSPAAPAAAPAAASSSAPSRQSMMSSLSSLLQQTDCGPRGRADDRGIKCKRAGLMDIVEGCDGKYSSSTGGGYSQGGVVVQDTTTYRCSGKKFRRTGGTHHWTEMQFVVARKVTLWVRKPGWIVLINDREWVVYTTRQELAEQIADLARRLGGLGG